MLRTEAAMAVWGDARHGSSWRSYVSRHDDVMPRRNGTGVTGGSERETAIRDITSNMEREPLYFVYILANKPNGTLYFGVTDNLVRRVQQHRDGLVAGFSKRYAVQLLVYFETLTDINAAIFREKSIKRWRRQWKVELIEAQNPQWRDLLLELISQDQ